ncbi:MAG: hypothetical protein KJZ65_06580 [Phycisphaerales bacterium]|nr:hypothetical protein [Phycisphaerales bacterium]
MGKTSRPTPDFAPYVLRGEAIQAVQISALWFADGAPQLPNTVKIKRALRRVAIGLGETEVSAGHGDWLILTSESTPVLMSDRDFRMLFRPALEQAPATSDQAPEAGDQPTRTVYLDDDYLIDSKRKDGRVAALAAFVPSPHLPDSPLATRDLAPAPEVRP